MSLRGVVHRVRERLRPRSPAPCILMYHRVASVLRDPWDIAVTPATFDAQMAYLRRHRQPLPLVEFAKQLQRGTLASDAVAVTFDDGYTDNLKIAKPILESYEIPATLFLATGWVGSKVPFWWDELLEMILASPVARNVRVECGGDLLDLVWGEPEALDATNSWRGLEAPKTARQAVYFTVWRTLQRASERERDAAMATLRQHFDVLPFDSLSMPMRSDEVREFVRGGLCSLGAHTVSHPALTVLPTEVCRDEVSEGRTQCRVYTGTEVTCFAYPYGDYNAEVRDAVQSAGFEVACSTRASHIEPNSFDPYALPRLAAMEQPLRMFQRALQR